MLIVFIMITITACKPDDPQKVELPIETFDVVGEIKLLQWSPDGTRLAGGGHINQLAVWDVKSGKELFSYEFSDVWLSDICWTNDGSQLIAAFESGELVVWNSSTGEILHRISENVEFWNKSKAYTAVACSPSNSLVATGQAGGNFLIWDSSNWQKKPIQVETHETMINNIVWTSDGAKVAEEHYGYLNLWQLSESDYVVVQEMRPVSGEKLAFSPDGMFLLQAGTLFRSIHKWNVVTEEQSHIFWWGLATMYVSGVNVGIGWDKTGQFFATAEDNGRISLWENATDERLYFLRTPRHITSMAWSPIENVLAMGGRHEIMLIDISDLVEKTH